MWHLLVSRLVDYEQFWSTASFIAGLRLHEKYKWLNLQYWQHQISSSSRFKLYKTFLFLVLKNSAHCTMLHQLYSILLMLTHFLPLVEPFLIASQLKLPKINMMHTLRLSGPSWRLFLQITQMTNELISILMALWAMVKLVLVFTVTDFFRNLMQLILVPLILIWRPMP